MREALGVPLAIGGVKMSKDGGVITGEKGFGKEGENAGSGGERDGAGEGGGQDVGGGGRRRRTITFGDDAPLLESAEKQVPDRDRALTLGAVEPLREGVEGVGAGFNGSEVSG